MLVFIIYMISIIDALLGLFVCALFVIAVAAIFGPMILDLYHKDEIASFYKKFIKPTIIIAAIIVLIPSKQTAYTMLAAYGMQEIAQTDEAKRIGSKSIQVIEKALDEYLEEEKGND